MPTPRRARQAWTNCQTSCTDCKEQEGTQWGSPLGFRGPRRNQPLWALSWDRSKRPRVTLVTGAQQEEVPLTRPLLAVALHTSLEKPEKGLCCWGQRTPAGPGAAQCSVPAGCLGSQRCTNLVLTIKSMNVLNRVKSESFCKVTMQTGALETLPGHVFQRKGRGLTPNGQGTQTQRRPGRGTTERGTG